MGLTEEAWYPRDRERAGDPLPPRLRRSVPAGDLNLLESGLSMTLEDLVQLLHGNVLTEESDLSKEVKGGCGADLMSDVLASIQPEAVLLTGLCGPQVVRTAQMADVAAIVIVRGKKPPQETVALAQQEGIPLISTRYGMFEACGRLYAAGLPGLETSVTG